MFHLEGNCICALVLSLSLSAYLSLYISKDTWSAFLCPVSLASCYCSPQFSSVHLLSHVRLFATPWTATRQASLSVTNSQSLLKFMSMDSVMPSNHLNLCHSLLLLPSIFPSIRVFLMSQFFTSGGQSIGVSASASVLPMNIQDKFNLGLNGLISLQSKGLSSIFSNTTVQKHLFLSAQPFLWSILTSIHNYWKSHKTLALAIWTFISKVMSLLFNMLSRFIIAFLKGASIF